jgi:FKBP-type peptidyl-prolyl cis-trans isomerase FkpA
MKRIALVVFVVSLLISCVKKDDNCRYNDFGDPKATAGEISVIQTYLTNNSLTATQHSSGIFYNITNAGTGIGIQDQCSGVTVKYVGKLTNGTVFDAPTDASSFTLYGLITGWRIGIPLIKTGGSIRLYIPPSLGYGASAVGNIPGNSILVFDIDLLAVSN